MTLKLSLFGGCLRWNCPSQATIRAHTFVKTVETIPHWQHFNTQESLANWKLAMGAFETALHGNAFHEEYMASGPAGLLKTHGKGKFKKLCITFSSDMNAKIQALSRETSALVCMKNARELALAGERKS